MAKPNPFNKSVGKRRISVFRFTAVLLLFVGLGWNLFLGFEQSKEEDDASRNTHLKTNESVFPKGLLPKRIYTVTGLESSGTNFVSSILAHALGIGQYRQSGTGGRGGNDDVWVQHMSLPTGHTCEKYPNPQIQNVVLPGVCTTSDPAFGTACAEMANEANVTIANGRARYPPRYFLDIVSNKEWYESKGVEQVVIIVIRDRHMARKGRSQSGYCQNETLLLKEEEVGMDIINRAIHEYILSHRRLLASMSSFGSVYDDSLWREAKDINDYNTNDRDDAHRELSQILPSGNNVVLVSYESLIKLEEVYIQMLYKTLGIESDYIPTIKDGNEKYMNPSPNSTYNHGAHGRMKQRRRERRRKNNH